MSEMDGLLKAFDDISAFVHYKDAVRRKREQISSVSASRCGNCDHWMKTTCKPEKQLKQFKSSGSLACCDFARSSSSESLRLQFEGEFSKIESDYATRDRDTV